MPFMVKFWRNARLGILVLMFFGTLFYLVATFPFARYFGRAPTYAREIAEGQPIVDAIYKFKSERGLWPEYLDDLAPEFLPKRPSLKWNYKVLPGGPSLATPIGNEDSMGYDFDPSAPTWRALEGYNDRVLKRAKPPTLTTLPAATLADHQLRELDRRLVSDRGWMGHWRAKASILRSQGRIDEAKAAIAAAKASDDSHFWPRLGEAVMDQQSAPEFEKWVHEHPTFSHFYYLSLMHRLANQDAAALAATEEAIKQRITAAPEDFSPPALFLWDMARFALSKGRYDLVLKITDGWEKMQSDRRREEDSYLALAAAAKLAKGDSAGAQAELKKLTARKTATWAKNVDALRDAANRGDTGFRYDPGPNPPAFQVFQLPE